MRALLSEHVPQHGVLGEEHGAVRTDADYVWVIDPIDGTKAYITGLPIFGTLIALLHRGRPVLGIIDQPILGERWLGVEGESTTLNGRPIRESTGTTKIGVAKTILKQREGRAAAGLPIMPRADRIRYDEIEADLRQHYQATGSRDIKEYGRRVKHLTAAFSGRRVAAISQVDVDGYVVARQGRKAKNATIRRELGTLTKMLRLAYQNGKLLRLPILLKPKEGAPREGFFEHEQFVLFRFEHAADGDAGPGADDLGNLVLGHFPPEQTLARRLLLL